MTLGEKDALIGELSNLASAMDEHMHRPVMHLAVEYRKIEAVKMLLANGYDVNSHSKDWGETALTTALRKYDKEMCELLIAAGADVNAVNCENGTALHEYGCLCAHTGHLDVCKVLIDAGADVNIKNLLGRTPLHLACIEGRANLAAMYIEAGADVNALDNGEWTPLHEAASKGSLACVKLLAENGADFDAFSRSGYTILHCAVRSNSEATVSFVLRFASNIEAETRHGETALNLAGYGRIADILRKKGATK